MILKPRNPGSFGARTLKYVYGLRLNPNSAPGVAVVESALGWLQGVQVHPDPHVLWLQWIQSTLWERHGIRTLRRTLADFGPAGTAHLDETTGDLTVDGAPQDCRAKGD